MAGERSVRIDFEAQEELSRAVQRIDKALDQLKGSLGGFATAAQGADLSADDLHRSVDEIGDEANEATVKLSGLMGQLAAFESFEEGVGVDIPIEVDDPSDVSLREVRDKVAAKMRSQAGDSPEIDILADADEEQLIREIEKSKSFVEDISKVDKPMVDIGVDFEEGTLFREIKEAEEKMESAADEVDFDADIDTGEISREAKEASEAAESAAGEIEVNLQVPEGQKKGAMLDVGRATSWIESTKSAIVELKLRVPEGQKQYAMLEVAKATKFIETSTANNVDLNIKLDASDDILELAALISAMSATKAQALQTAVATKSAASGIDDVGDEAAESAVELGFFATAANMASLNTTALSLNVGAFNIALANLATQIPILIGLLGTLGTAIMGVAGAALLATTAWAGLVGGAFLAELTRVEEQFDNIENKMEAMQAIMESLIDVFVDAFEPLIEAGQEADFFFSTINGLLRTINAFAKGIADSMEIAGAEMDNFIATGKNLGIISDEMSDAEIDEEIMSLGEFFSEMSRIWSENAADIISATKVMSAFLLPILRDIIEFFIAGMDDMMLFVTKFTHELQSIGPALRGVIDFAVQLVELTSTILQGLIPVFVGLMSIATEVARVFNGLNNSIVRNAAALALFTKIVHSVHGALGGLTKAVWQLTLGLANQALAHHFTALAAAREAGRITTLQAVKLGLIGTSIALTDALKREAIMHRLSNSAIGSAISRLYTLVIAKLASAAASYTQAGGLWSAVAGLIAYTAAALTGATATSILMSPLLPVVAALAALAAIGAVVIGVLANMDSVTSGLKSALESIKQGIADIVNILLGVFISVWNSIMDMWQGLTAVTDALSDSFSMIAEALGFASSEGSMLNSIWGVMMEALEALFVPIEWLFSILGKLAYILGGLLGAYIRYIAGVTMLLINAWKALIGVIADGVDWFLKFIGVSGGLSGVIGKITGGIGDLIEVLKGLPGAAKEAFGGFVDWLESMVNDSIDILNGLIEEIPEPIREGLGLETMEHIELSGPDQTGKLSREDVVSSDAEDAENEVTARSANNFNYNEENINNVAQEINADPEEKESLRRVVKDAMEEANAFQRRNQGHGG